MIILNIWQYANQTFADQVKDVIEYSIEMFNSENVAASLLYSFAPLCSDLEDLCRGISSMIVIIAIIATQQIIVINHPHTLTRTFRE